MNDGAMPVWEGEDNLPVWEASKKNLLEKFKDYALKAPASGGFKMLRDMTKSLPQTEFIPALFEAQGADISDEGINKYMGLPSQADQPIGMQAMQMVPEVAGAAMMPGANLGKGAKYLSKLPGFAGKIAPKMASESVGQGAYAAMTSPEESRPEAVGMAMGVTAPFAGASKMAQVTPSALVRGGLATGTGLAAGGLGYELGQQSGLGTTGSSIMAGLLGLGGYKSLATPETKMLKQLQDVDLNDPKVQEILNAAERLGINITPAEAAENPFLARVHSRLGRTSKGSKKSYEKAYDRIGQEESSINRLLQDIYDPNEFDSVVGAAYDNIYPEQVPLSIPMQFASNRTIQKIDKTIRNDPEIMQALEQKGANLHTSLGYWDVVKRYLDREIENFSLPTAKSKDKLKVPAMENLRRDLLGQLDLVSPEYTQARSLSQRSIARDKIQNVFNKQEIKSGNAFYKYLKDDRAFNELKEMLNDVPQAQQALEDMRLIFKEARTAPKLSRSAGLEDVGMFQNRNPLDALKYFINGLMHDGKFDEQALDFIYGGQWADGMAELNRITDKQLKAAKGIELIGRATGNIASEAMND